MNKADDVLAATTATDATTATVLFNARQPVHEKVRRNTATAKGILTHSLDVLFPSPNSFLFLRRTTNPPKKETPPLVIQTSLVAAAAAAPDLLFHTTQGFVGIASAAYNYHHALILRPDDVWQALVIQFSFYVQARAEALRDRLVDFQGKKQLVVKAAGTLCSVDHGFLAERMVDQIRENIRDPAVADWLMPAFSTTTTNDRVVASVSVMATLQAYFDYKFQLQCGIPSVHLLGTEADWELLQSKLDRFLEFALPPAASEAAGGGESIIAHWVASLRPVLAEMLATKRGADNMASFWEHILCTTGGGSGPRYISGWIRAFCAFTEKGKYQGHQPRIDTSDIPSGMLSVPVTVDDNGVEHKCTLIAGQMCASATAMQGTALQPRSDWMMVQATLPTAAEAAATEDQEFENSDDCESDDYW